MAKNIIKCPVCGAEYLPAEIYIPDAFFGRPTDIEKDHITGAIRTYFGSAMDRNENYTCDYCNTPFSITAKINFITAVDEKINFNKDYTTTLKHSNYNLRED